MIHVVLVKGELTPVVHLSTCFRRLLLVLTNKHTIESGRILEHRVWELGLTLGLPGFGALGAVRLRVDVGIFFSRLALLACCRLPCWRNEYV